LVQKTIEYNPQANIMHEEQADRMREEHPFELNMVIQEETIIAARLHCFSTEEEEGSQDQCLYKYPGNISDNRVLIAGVVYEKELDVENRKRRLDIDRRWLVDSGASSHYIKEISKFRAYKWLPKAVKINMGKGPIWGIARGEVDIGMVIGKVVIGNVPLVPDLDVESDLLFVTVLMQAGFGVNFERGLAEIHKDKQTWGVASPTSKNDGSLCYLEEYEKVQHYALAI